MPERAITIALIYAATCLVLLGRLFVLQVVQGEDHAAAVQDSRERVELLPAKRGRILDRTGTAIVDNRAIYRASVVLSDLELSWRVRRTLPYFELDEAACDALVADLAIRLSRDHAAVRNALIAEWSDDPFVAFRRGSEPRSTDLTLLAVPGAALAPREDDDGRTAALATSGLVHADPRVALRREILARWGEVCFLFTPEEFALATAAIDADSAISAARCHTVLSSFAPVVSATVGSGDQARTLRLHLLTEERRRQAEEVLARFLGKRIEDIQERLDRALSSATQPMEPWDVYFAADSDALEVVALLPPLSELHPIPLEGVPPAHERIILIQGDRVGIGGDAMTRSCRRLAASFGAPGDWIAGLVEKHARRTRIQNAERSYRSKLLALDIDLVDRLTVSLSKILGAQGLPTSSLDLERGLARVRRIADREWAGMGHHDPIPLVEEISHRLSQILDGGAAKVPRDLAKAYDGTEPRLPGLHVTVDSGREYPFGDALCHLLGTLGRVDHRFDHDRALELGLDPEGSIGRSGLERHYDEHLRGVIGRRIWRHTTDGVELIHERLAEPGRDLITEIDAELQTTAEDALDHWYTLAEQLSLATGKMDKARGVGKGRAGMVVMDPRTGGILALASSPRYHPEERGTRWEDLLKDPREPLHDHASEGSQPPGSTLKVLTALAALEIGVMTPHERITTKGYMAMVAGRQVLRSHAPAGTYDLISALAVSDNCYFAIMGQRMGAERMSSYFWNFGLGRPVALDVPQERGGLLPRPATLGRRWATSDSWRMAIGQFNTMSPLQAATIAAAVANGGHIVTPHVVRPAGGAEVRDLNVRFEHLEQLRRAMEAVTEPGGTASHLQLGGDFRAIHIAAKTGTSEWGNTDPERFPDHAFLIGYAPAENPTVVFSIFIHSGTSGGRACTGVAKKVLETYFRKYGSLATR